MDHIDQIDHIDPMDHTEMKQHKTHSGGPCTSCGTLRRPDVMRAYLRVFVFYVIIS